MKEIFEELNKVDDYEKLMKKYNLNDDDFIDESDKIVFLEYLKHPDYLLMEMANVRGIDVKTDFRLPFSFYFSSKLAVKNAHGIRAKIIWNPAKAPADADGYMKLHGDYEYTVGSHKYKPTEKELKIARDFFKKYKVLFAAVWEGKLYDNHLISFFNKRMTFKELLTNFEEITEKQFFDLNHCKDLIELEDCVRKNKIFNLND